MREIRTTLENVLSHVCCASDYGYDDDILMSDFATLTGYVSDNEIAEYIELNKSVKYSQEDYSQWEIKIIEWRTKYAFK